MCLAVPAEVLTVNGDTAVVSLYGALREVNVTLVEGVSVGDYVLVHAGFALERWTAADVEEWKMIMEGNWPDVGDETAS